MSQTEVSAPAEVVELSQTTDENANVKELAKAKITDDEVTPAVEAKGDAISAPKKRGRPPKRSLVTAEASDGSQSTVGDEPAKTDAEPSKEKDEVAETPAGPKETVIEDDGESVPRKRGRPPKLSTETAIADDEEIAVVTDVVDAGEEVNAADDAKTDVEEAEPTKAEDGEKQPPAAKE